MPSSFSSITGFLKGFLPSRMTCYIHGMAHNLLLVVSYRQAGRQCLGRFVMQSYICIPVVVSLLSSSQSASQKVVDEGRQLHRSPLAPLGGFLHGHG